MQTFEVSRNNRSPLVSTLNKEAQPPVEKQPRHNDSEEKNTKQVTQVEHKVQSGSGQNKSTAMEEHKEDSGSGNGLQKSNLLWNFQIAWRLSTAKVYWSWEGIPEWNAFRSSIVSTGIRRDLLEVACALDNVDFLWDSKCFKRTICTEINIYQNFGHAHEVANA